MKCCRALNTISRNSDVVVVKTMNVVMRFDIMLANAFCIVWGHILCFQKVDDFFGVLSVVARETRARFSSLFAVPQTWRVAEAFPRQ